MLFCNSNQVNKLVLLRHKLYPVFLCLFKTALINLAERSTVLLCAFTVSKKVKIIDKPNRVYLLILISPYIHIRYRIN
jgi:hypothetical protein